MLTNLWTALLAVLMPYVVGVLTKWLMNALKTVTVVDNAPNGGKRLIVVILSTILTVAFGWAGLHVTDLNAVTADQVSTLATALAGGLSALVSAVYAMAAHAGDKASPDVSR